MSGKMLEDYVEAGEKAVSPYEERLQYCGRMDFDYEGGPLWVYPCSYVKLRFTGKSIKAVFANHKGYWNSEIGWILDGQEGQCRLSDTGVTVVEVANNLQEGEHELVLYKRMDACHMLIFHGFIVDAEFELLEPPVRPARRIEVYGDSVSAGEVSEAVEYCGQPDPEHNGEYSNSYYSYSWITARKLGAELHNIAQGGIALLEGEGYFNMPETKGMEYMYDKIQYQPWFGFKEWDFSEYVPQLVLLAIGQNDKHPYDYMKEDYDGEKAVHWRSRYATFIRKLRSLYPQAHIICKTTILNHDMSWDRAIAQVVGELEDEQVHYFEYSNNSIGTPGHVRRPEAEKMAEELSVFIEELNEQWNFFLE
jgi:hypothetical protein